MKIIAKTLALSIALISATSFASNYASPNELRGEITTPVENIGNANLLTTPVSGLPSVLATASNVNYIKTVIIPANQSKSTYLDVTLLDDLVDDVTPNARHYPTNFPNRTAEFITAENIKYLSDWIEPYASAKDASFDVVLRAAKINGMARNLNIGTDYSLRANTYMAKAVKLEPNNPEANFLYGMMISETGGFNEGKKYLEKAASLGQVEAEQSLVQSELLSDNKSGALAHLQALQAKYPNNAQIAEQLNIVNNGGFYIWNIKDNNINVKPIKK